MAEGGIEQKVFKYVVLPLAKAALSKVGGMIGVEIASMLLPEIFGDDSPPPPSITVEDLEKANDELFERLHSDTLNIVTSAFRTADLKRARRTVKTIADYLNNPVSERQVHEALSNQNTAQSVIQSLTNFRNDLSTHALPAFHPTESDKEDLRTGLMFSFAVAASLLILCRYHLALLENPTDPDKTAEAALMRQDAARFADKIGDFARASVTKRLGYVTEVETFQDDLAGQIWTFMVGPKINPVIFGGRTVYFPHQKVFAERSGARGGSNTAYPELRPYQFDIKAYRDYCYEEVRFQALEAVSGMLDLEKLLRIYAMAPGAQQGHFVHMSGDLEMLRIDPLPQTQIAVTGEMLKAMPFKRYEAGYFGPRLPGDQIPEVPSATYMGPDDVVLNAHGTPSLYTRFHTKQSLRNAFGRAHHFALNDWVSHDGAMTFRHKHGTWTEYHQGKAAFTWQEMTRRMDDAELFLLNGFAAAHSNQPEYQTSASLTRLTAEGFDDGDGTTGLEINDYKSRWGLPGNWIEAGVPTLQVNGGARTYSWAINEWNFYTKGRLRMNLKPHGLRIGYKSFVILYDPSRDFWLKLFKGNAMIRTARDTDPFQLATGTFVS